jgi:hypothetical protein
MILSRANLAVREVVGDAEGLNVVHIDADGSTVASNGRVLLAVGPIDPNRVQMPGIGQAAPGTFGVNVPPKTVDIAVRNIPKDRNAPQAVAVTQCDDDTIELTTQSATETQRVSARPVRVRFSNWRDVLQNVRKALKPDRRICISRKDAIDLLNAMEHAAGVGDEGAVFIEFGSETDAILIRGYNAVNGGQRIIGVIKPLVAGEWLALSRWERVVFSLFAKTPRAQR